MKRIDTQAQGLFSGIEMGVGTWAWGDRLYWGFGKGYKQEDLKEAFDISLASGLTFFDTAEVYGQGSSEKYLGKFMEQYGQRVKVATKFMPFPWRLNGKALLRALKGSLKRLGMERVDLYQLHYPLPPVALESWVKAMLSAMQSGWIDAIGISNCSSNQMLRAHELLLKAGAALTSNQVEYHLLNRSAETVGLLKRCKETGITLISYSPLAMGILSGKYSPSNLPAGIRGSRYNARTLARIQPLITLLHQIGADRGGKTAAQTAINWVICKGALPIPGAKDRYQAEENAGAAGWRLTDDEVAELDAMSDEVNRLE